MRGLVVQPGVEFDAWAVADYEPERTRELQWVLDDEPGIVFEAHSTDYQTPERLTDLVRDHWAILKVGPALTFALREALFALTGIESELLPPQGQSRLREVLERQMLAHPAHWASYYLGDDESQRIARAYSYSDRLRYYWPDPEVNEASGAFLRTLHGSRSRCRCSPSDFRSSTPGCARARYLPRRGPSSVTTSQRCCANTARPASPQRGADTAHRRVGRVMCRVDLPPAPAYGRCPLNLVEPAHRVRRLLDLEPLTAPQ